MIRLASSPIRAAVPRRADPPINFLLFRRRLGGSISPAAVSAIASAIQTQEGYYPGSLAYQNNNPGNLVSAGQAGASPGTGGFAKFATYTQGRQALEDQITLDATRGTDVNGNPTTTLAQLISSWAPPSENNTAVYIANVSQATGYDPNAPLSSLGASDGLLTMPAGLSSSTVTYDTAYSDVPSSGIDLSSLGDGSIDLSGIGLPSSVPVLAAVAGGLIGLSLLSRLF